MPNSVTGGNNTTNLELLTWNEVRVLTASFSVTCGARVLLDRLSNTISAACLKKCRFLKLSYAYGDRIVDNGKFCLPSMLSGGANRVPVLEGFGARNVPLAFLLDRNVEIFCDVLPQQERGHFIPPKMPFMDLQKSAGHTRPLRVFQRGELFGLFQLVDAWRGRSPIIEDYSLSAGEMSIYVGVPMHSKEVRSALSSLNDNLHWQRYQRHSLLIKELLKNASWKCTIVLIPDSLCQEIYKSPEAKNLIYETHIVQMSQDKDDMNERNYLRDLPVNDAERYHEQIAYLLGIVRGQIPAMVPWQKAATELPLRPLIELLADHFRKRPTNKSVESRYFPYILVPKLLRSGEHGYFSCWWNLGPIVPREEPFEQVTNIFSILSDERCVPKLFSLPAENVFQRYSNGKRRNKNNSVQGLWKSIDIEDFIPVAELKKDMSSGPSTKPDESAVTPWPGGFLSAGFKITRPK